MTQKECVDARNIVRAMRALKDEKVKPALEHVYHCPYCTRWIIKEKVVSVVTLRMLSLGIIK